jgi:peptide/nickel transport system substrate-binding protein
MIRHIGWRMTFLWLCICLIGAACKDGRFETEAETPGPPVHGGTLEILGSDVDHLSTTSANVSDTMGLLRTFSRTLISYRASADFKTAVRLEPDVAMEVPSLENGGITAGGLSYTFHLRRGVRWNSSPPRELTAHDFVRGFKLFGNPVSPVGAPYYTSTIKGLSSYCSRFATVPGDVRAIREFVSNNEIEGIRALDERTLVFHLLSPTSDFLELLAMTFASPVPIEYLDYRPDSPEFRQHTLSIGPYRIARYIQNREMLLERNPVWDPATDPLRPAYVDRIHFRFGMDTQLQQLQVAAGTADMSNDPAPAPELSALLADKTSTMWLPPPGDISLGFSYLVINHVGRNNHSATGKIQVRRAIALAVDKAAIVQESGGPRLGHVLRQAVPSCACGYKKGADRYTTPGDRGNPGEARALLAAAGYPDGIAVRLAHWTGDSIRAQALQASLGRAGITVELRALPLGDLFGRLLTNPEDARHGEWDLALVGWILDWYGNNGRDAIQPLFDSRFFGKTTVNYGGYRNPEVDSLIDRATTAASVQAAEQAWSEAAQRITEDVAIVPLIEYKLPYATSRRLRNRMWNGVSLKCDIPSVWLADAVPNKRSSQ